MQTLDVQIIGSLKLITKSSGQYDISGHLSPPMIQKVTTIITVPLHRHDMDQTSKFKQIQADSYKKLYKKFLKAMQVPI